MSATEVCTENIPLSTLVTRAQAGDPDVWEELVFRSMPIVCSTVRSLISDYHVAQEVQQDVFMRVFQNIHHLRESNCFLLWIRTIARRRAINRMVRDRQEFLMGNMGDFGPQRHRDGLESPLDHLLEKERAEHVHAGIAQLREMDRKVLEAFYDEGQSIKKISVTLDAPPGTIKRRLHIARHRLNEILEETFVL